MLFVLVVGVELVEALKIVFSMVLCDFETFLLFFRAILTCLDRNSLNS